MSILQKQDRGSDKGNTNQDVLTDAYEQTLTRINNQRPGLRKLAIDVLSWITCAKQRLTTRELQHALATTAGKSSLDPGDLLHVEDMVSVCAGLVTVDKGSSVIRLVHYTTQEYLERTRQQWFPNADSVITTACITYLSFSTFEEGFCKRDREFEKRLQSNPLYGYAAQNWGYHASNDPDSVPLVLGFLESKACLEPSSQTLMAAKRYSSHERYSQEAPRKVTGLHLAGYFGATKVADALLKLGHLPDIKDTYGRTPLWYASKNGHEDVMGLLIAAGAAANTCSSRDGWTALQRAVKAVI